MNKKQRKELSQLADFGFLITPSILSPKDLPESQNFDREEKLSPLYGSDSLNWTYHPVGSDCFVIIVQLV